MTSGMAAAVTGYKSFHGIPSSPVFIDGAGGTKGHIAVGYSDGNIGRIYWPVPGKDSPPVTDPRTSWIDAGVVKGRVTWKLLK